MSLFQLLALPIISFLFLMSLLRLRGRARGRLVAVAESSVWLAAGAAIALPDGTMQIANVLGIGRGADLVLYLLVISQFIVWFHFYQRVQQLEATISETVRQLAIREALTVWRPPAPELAEDGTRQQVHHLRGEG
jgi:hypothetical protein